MNIGLLIACMYWLTAPSAVCSWYGESWNGNLTASGVVYDCTEISCAHKTFPLGTVVRFYNVETGVYLDARILDRGPYIAGRDFDLSTAAFDSLADLDVGVLTLRYRILSRDITGLRYNLNGCEESCYYERLDRW